MKRIRYTLDGNNKVTNTDSLELIYVRIQPITVDQGREGQYTGQKIFFKPYVDIRATDKIEYAQKVYDIHSYYKVKDAQGNDHHLEIII